jgi:hypothetical protein
MDRSAYLKLRFAVELEVANGIDENKSDQQALVNTLMRAFLDVLAQQELVRQESRRKLKTFRRRPDVKPPAWAFREPGSVPIFRPMR